MNIQSFFQQLQEIKPLRLKTYQSGLEVEEPAEMSINALMHITSGTHILNKCYVKQILF